MNMTLNTFRFAELKLGQKETIQFIVDQAKVDAFVALSGDSNPLHTNVEYCRSQKIPGTLVHGWLTGSWISTLIGMRLPGKFSRFLSVKVSWPKPVFINDQIELSGEIIVLSEGTRTVELKLKAKNAAGDVVLKGTALIGVLE